MNPFKFSPDNWDPYAAPARARWLSKRQWKWPEDYRACMGWVFALTILTSLLNIVRAAFHPQPLTLLQNALDGPIFYSVMVAMNGTALWAIWRDKAWARGWAVAASSFYFLIFLRQFIIPMRPIWDHYLFSLVVAVAGVIAFSSRDKEVGTAHSDSINS